MVRGLLFHRLAQQAIALGPAPYRQIIATNQPGPALEATCVKGIPTFAKGRQVRNSASRRHSRKAWSTMISDGGTSKSVPCAVVAGISRLSRPLLNAAP